MTDFEIVESLLKVVIAETGEIYPHVGGFEIKVFDPVVFPWGKVLTYLLDIPHNVWITKENGNLVIKTKPPSI